MFVYKIHACRSTCMLNHSNESLVGNLETHFSCFHRVAQKMSAKMDFLIISLYTFVCLHAKFDEQYH